MGAGDLLFSDKGQINAFGVIPFTNPSNTQGKWQTTWSVHDQNSMSDTLWYGQIVCN
jgi:hypothetical protein